MTNTLAEIYQEIKFWVVPKKFHCAECNCEVSKKRAVMSLFCEPCYDRIWAAYK